MIRFHALGTAFSLPLLTLLTPLLAIRLGMNGAMAGVGVSLCIHELGHLLAARLAGVEIREIRILPFGGSARMENPYGLRPAQLLGTAIAGPAANLLLMVLCAAMAHWKLLSIFQASGVIRPSMTLLLFNLLPALPLDGGRMLYALLNRTLGMERALRLGILLGRILAIMLLLGCVLLRMRTGKWNLSFILAAVFILSSERDERDALLRSRAEMLDKALSPAAPRPMRFYQIDAQTRSSDALRLLRPRESAWFVLTENGAPKGMVDSCSIIQQLMENEDALLSELQECRILFTPHPIACGDHLPLKGKASG